MTRGQAILAGAAAILVASAVPFAARADELSDLRANSLLLQQKIDQARALNGDAPAASAPDGQSSLQGGFPGSFRVPGTETSVRVGGNVTAIAHDSLGR
jgi:type II secretory pathway pseudopilin PulG